MKSYCCYKSYRCNHCEGTVRAVKPDGKIMYQNGDPGSQGWIRECPKDLLEWSTLRQQARNVSLIYLICMVTVMNGKLNGVSCQAMQLQAFTVVSFTPN